MAALRKLLTRSGLPSAIPDLGHRAGGLQVATSQLEQSIASDVIALREKQIGFVLGVDMRDVPVVLDDRNGLAETRSE